MNQPNGKKQRGVTLIVVMLILIIISILGVGAAQIAIMGEKGSRNERDMQLAWQSAEAALIDAEFEMVPVATGSGGALLTSPRRDQFVPQNFIVNCGNAGIQKGLCAEVSGVNPNQPAWLTVDLTSSVNTTPLGSFTGRAFQTNATGILPGKLPNYIIEQIPDTSPLGNAGRGSNGGNANPFLYRVTAMGFGPGTNPKSQAVTQMIFRKE